MERITFLIERTHHRLTCLLNPEDRADSLTLERSSGIARAEGGSLLDTQLSDSPVQVRGKGDTRLTLKLLFDVSLVEPSVRPKDVRELTSPLWELTEYTAGSRSIQPGSRAGTAARLSQTNRALPQVRIFWGRGWEIPAVVESVAERYEHFSEIGLPQRSWMTLRLLRVSDDIPPAEVPLHNFAQTLPDIEELAAAGPVAMQADQDWGAHVKIGSEAQGDQLWQLAEQYLGNASLWRWIAIFNNIADPQNIPAGTVLCMPPLQLLASLLRARQPK